jgi:epoxyqueuosine reductase
MRLALHTCCGPCLLEPLDALTHEAEQITVVYANPNIHPSEEYARRLSTLKQYAQTIGAKVVELPYEPQVWAERVGVHGDDASARCRACYELRLGLTAEWAAENGCDAIATTLTVSPYQDIEAIAEEGARAASQHGIEYLARDFRDRYAEATRRSRELEMYRQNYCGCVYSEGEARRQREARRAARRQVSE